MESHDFCGHIQFNDRECSLMLLDQRNLPLKEEFVTCTTIEQLVLALREMVVRGAPAIGVSAAYGCCLALREAGGEDGWQETLEHLLQKLEAARPTAVNLRWAVNHMRSVRRSNGDISWEQLKELWVQTARNMHRWDVKANRAMGEHGAALLEDGDVVMTHCNAGALATGGYGTALGVIRAAVAQGKRISVIANETRPLLQGARLTAYEMVQEGIPVHLACDNASSMLMSKGLVSKVIVGADRIAANGDVANKIGTSGLAILAGHYHVPLYVAAPCTTVDTSTPTGADIPIECRDGDEILHCLGTRAAPFGVEAYNFAFDITPWELIAAIITEQGVLRPPYRQAIAGLQSARFFEGSEN
jgi:methylthioribose-1-phosphate isomerase